MRRALLMLGGLSLAGCATVVPMQTASVVPEGHWRAGVQASTAYCGAGDVTRCHDYPDGVPAPEMRVNARRGIARSSDLGVSLQVQPAVLSAERPLQLGLALDARRELLRFSLPEDRAHVVSAGLQGAGAVYGRLGLAPSLQGELALPVHYGYQTPRFEWVAGLSLSHRVLLRSVGGAPEPGPLRTWRIGGSLGVYRRSPARWGAQLSYLTLPAQRSSAALVLGVGWFWDVSD